jgi:hypothetical protein
MDSDKVSNPTHWKRRLQQVASGLNNPNRAGIIAALSHYSTICQFQSPKPRACTGT